MNRSYRNILSTALALSIVAITIGAIAATRRDFSVRNVRLFAGMDDSPAAEAQSVNSVLRGGTTMQPPVAGTIARGFTPFRFADTVKDRKKAAGILKNPLAASPETLERGQWAYENFCAHCHGAKGYGDGPVALRTKLSMSIVDTQTRERRDGDIFHIITYGRLYMPPHESLLSQDDRWKLIHYVRKLQADERAKDEPSSGPGW